MPTGPFGTIVFRGKKYQSGAELHMEKSQLTRTAVSYKAQHLWSILLLFKYIKICNVTKLLAYEIQTPFK